MCISLSLFCLNKKYLKEKTGANILQSGPGPGAKLVWTHSQTSELRPQTDTSFTLLVPSIQFI